MARRLIEKIESRATLFLSLLILALIFVPPMLSQLLADKTPPIRAFHSAEALNSPIKAGELLIVRIKRDKVRDDCPVSSERQAVNQDGVVFSLPPATWSGGPTDVDYLDFAYPTLPSMRIGDYELRVHLTYRCPNVSDPFEYDQPPVRFRVR